MIKILYKYYVDHVDRLPDYLKNMEERKEASRERIVCDYVSSMTDRYAVAVFEEVFVPRSWAVL